MKKIIAIASMLMVVLLFLFACSKNTAVQNNSSLINEPILSQSNGSSQQSSNEGIITIIEISPKDADAGLIEYLGENMLTEGQEDAILALFQNVITGYHNGKLPLPERDEGESFLNSPLPSGVILPETVERNDIRWSSYDETWHMQGTLTLNDGNVLHVWVSQMFLDGKYYIKINQAAFDSEPKI